eukprot:CAMPEP_0117549386 /NCGR_PEP_ID=MMETSP0784-20121206/48138_1 /TAXON_ID=39447 /ORGANISM="" /LENGTH=237 /DNA_ID=CAMNT_0005346371 /DNA_START=23 /DNA_END=735 /DNA_ORIENTATION=-
MDVTSDDSVRDSIKVATETYGAPSILVTCAGSATPGYFLDQDASVFDKTMQLNYMGTVRVVKAVAPLMVEAEGGRIMLVASAAAVTAFIGYSSYSPSKFALRGFADALRNEMHGFGVKVSICYPPDTDTPGFREENKSKPRETLACFPGEAYSPEAVARQSVASLLRGDYTSSPPDLLQNLLVSSMSGVTPRSFVVLETLLIPLVTLVEQPFIRLASMRERGARRRRSNEQACIRGN